MPKTNLLFDHLTDPQFRDESSPILVPGDSKTRLKMWISQQVGSWEAVARWVHNMAGFDAAWVPDSNVLILDSTESVWDALRIAALGNERGSTVITSVVEAETNEWLGNPYRNQRRATDLKAALKGQTWVKRSAVRQDDALYIAVRGYCHLLGFRRFVTQATATGKTIVGTEPSDKCGTMNAVRDTLGRRAQGLAKKGRSDYERLGKVNISDELNVLTGVVYALRNSRHCVILTADVDYVEIFYKVQWFLDTHYRSWLVGRLISTGNYGAPCRRMDETHGFFQGPLTLYKRPTTHLREVLPEYTEHVNVTLIYVSPDNMIFTASFPFEPLMLEMMATRCRTNGQCTDRFGDANVHVDLGPLKSGMDGLYLGIGKDSALDFDYNGRRCRISKLDVAHSVFCFERSGGSVFVQK